MSITWSNESVTGINWIDSQHKNLILKIEKVLKAVKANKKTDEVNDLLDFMLDYSNFHFRTEEKYMLAHNFPDYKAHKNEHDILAANFKTLKNAVARYKNSEKLNKYIVSQVEEWYSTHIKDFDIRLASFLKKKQEET